MKAYKAYYYFLLLLNDPEIKNSIFFIGFQWVRFCPECSYFVLLVSNRFIKGNEGEIVQFQ